jgi:hypothetical protein
LAVAATRHAISPRLAMRIFLNMVGLLISKCLNAWMALGATLIHCA